MNSNLSKNISTTFMIALSAVCLSLSSCVKDIDDYSAPANSSTGEVTDINQLTAPAGFNYESDKEVNANITIKTNQDLGMPGIKINIMDKSPEDGGVILFTGITDNNGVMDVSMRMDKVLSEVIINTDYIGLPNNVIASVSGNSISSEIGGSNPHRVHCAQPSANNLRLQSGGSYRTTSVPTKTYLGSWNSNGVPNYLESARDNISSTFLARINYSLPERRPVPDYHPEYLSSTTRTTLDLNDSSDVWLTFVHEGAGFRNTLAYYTYATGSAPTSTNDISEIKVVFPNMSFSGSGGGMVSGDKVHIGSFGAGTSIGFVLLANGFDISNATVGDGYGQYYSDQELNPESGSVNQHNVLLYDSIEQKFVIGFEDINRTSNSCDNDFNDAIFFASANPIASVDRSGCPNTTPPTDSDGDGVTDLNDEYPNDATMAYNCYYPSITSFARLCFEDLWPAKGDFDMNDLIVAYRFNQIKNAQNKVVELKAKISVQSAGGSYQNGFGIELPISPSLVSSVTGTRLNHSYISNNSNGCEAGQNKAVIIAFDNALNLITRPPGYYVNCQNGAPYSTSDTLDITIQFTSALTTSQLGTQPFNPFMIVNLQRGVEVHLPDNTPTTLANTALLNTLQDASNPALGQYYKTKNNLPFALNVPATYNTILEKSAITQAYNHFATWVQSGGSQYPTWYSNASGYQNSSYIYQH